MHSQQWADNRTSTTFMRQHPRNRKLNQARPFVSYTCLFTQEQDATAYAPADQLQQLAELRLQLEEEQARRQAAELELEQTAEAALELWESMQVGLAMWLGVLGCAFMAVRSATRHVELQQPGETAVEMWQSMQVGVQPLACLAAV